MLVLPNGGYAFCSDGGGDPIASSFLAADLLKHKVPFELHVFPYGGRGALLGSEFVGSNPTSNAIGSTKHAVV